MTTRTRTQPGPHLGTVTIVLFALAAALVIAAFTMLWRTLGPKVIVAPDFALVDQDGRTFSLSALRGHPVVVFFGYTHCPDVCPTTLAHLVRAVHSRGVPLDERVVFITVDPERDSPGVLRRYVRLFDARFTGLTGSLTSLEPVYAAYHLWRQAVPAEHRGKPYSIVHGTTLYYVGRDGVMKGFGSWDDDTPELTRDLARFS